MKISPVGFYPLNYSQKPHKDVQNYKTENVNFTKNTTPFFVLPRNYSCRPISSLVPCYDVLDCNYSDINEFSSLFCQKINSQLMTISKNDIENLIQRLKTKTKAPKETIEKVLLGLTQFSSYKSLDIFQKYIEKYETIHFGLPYASSIDCEDYSLNTALSYLFRQKGMNETITKDSDTTLVVLDDTLLTQLEQLKQEKNPLFAKFLKNVEKGKVIFLNLKGWDVKCCDNKYRSANFLLGTGYLEDIALDVINKIQKGECLDEILYSDFEIRLHRLLKGYDYKFERVEGQNKDILSNVQKANFTKDDVSDVFEDFDDDYTKTILAKYFDEGSVVYSTDSMALALKNMYHKLTSKFGKDICYYIPHSNKSYGFINSIYAKLNQIPIDDICTRGLSHKKITSKENKTFVMLDDISATGESIIAYSKLDAKTGPIDKINCALLLTTPYALNWEWSEGEKPKDVNEIIYMNTVKNMNKNSSSSQYSLLNSDDINKLMSFLFFSWSALNLSCAFPHIIPDNCSELSGKLFDKLLIKSTPSSNKAYLST